LHAPAGHGAQGQRLPAAGRRQFAVKRDGRH
jgi:hypothetical protein